MKNTATTGTDTRPEQSKRNSMLLRILKIAGCTIAGVILLIVLLLTAVTLYLTPQRLTPIVTEYAGKYLDADFKASDLRFTVWSSFPHFSLEIDSVEVISRTLKNVPASIRNQLPESADSLAKIKGFSGGINLLKLIQGKICLSDVTIDGLYLNLVSYNDSINNYAIIPEDTDTPTKIPEFSAHRILLKNHGEINYFSSSQQVSGKLDLKSFAIQENDSLKNGYRLGLDALVSAKYGNLRLLSHFPVGIDGDINLNFKPFGVKLENFGINLGNMTTRLDMGISPEKSRIDKLDYRIDPVELVKFLAYLPQEIIPGISAMKSDISIYLSARLTEPYKYSTDSLPSFEIDINVPPSSLNYTMAGIGNFSFRNVVMKGKVDFNGKAPSQSTATLENLSFEAPGTSVRANGILTDIFGNPEIIANVKGKADCSRLLPIFNGARSVNLQGKADIDTHVKFNLTDAEKYGLAAILLTGKVGVKDFRYSVPGTDLILTGPSLNLDLLADHGALSGQGKIDGISVSGSAVKGNMKQVGLTVKGNSNNISNLSASLDAAKVSVQHADANINISELSLIAGNDSGALTTKGNIASLTTKTGNSNILLKDVGFNAAASQASSSLSLKARQAQANVGDMRMGLNDISLTTGFNNAPLATQNIKGKVKIYEDKQRNIRADVSSGLKNMLKYWKIYSLVQSGSGYLYHGHYPNPVRFGRLNIRASLDTFLLRRFEVQSQSNDVTIAGSVIGIRDFLTGGADFPDINLNISMDTLNLNEIAHTYYNGKMKRHNAIARNEKISDIRNLPEDPHELAASDTVEVLLPRNIKAHLGVKLNNAYYTNLHFYNIGTQLTMADAALTVDTLTLCSDFCNAFMNFKWDTDNAAATSMHAYLNITDAELTEIYANFPSILRMAPQMKNLTGCLSLSLNAGLGIFPNMYINMPSMTAQMGLNGTGLTLHQTKFIRHITKMLLIRTDDDIQIPNIAVRGSAHDNLLQLYPFILEFNRYRLSMMGVNDFGGNLYYHLSVLKSPIPMKFGINIRGNFDNPKVRFGSASYNVEDARKRLNITESDNINLMKELRYYFAKLVKMAAVSDN